MNAYMYPDTTRLQRWPLCAEIVATGKSLPKNIITNDDIIERYGHKVSAEAITKMVGIKTRHVAGDGVTDSDMLAEAGMACLTKAGLGADDISKLLVTPFLGDRLLPMTSAVVQRKLGCKTPVQAFDINGGAHSFFAAFHAAACAVDTGDAPVLVVSGGLNNHLISKRDLRLSFLFGDGAAAVLIAHAKAPKVLSTYAFSNHAFIDESVAFCIMDYTTEEMHSTGNYDCLFDLMTIVDWKRSQDYMIDAFGVTLRSLLADAQKQMGDIDLFLMTENHPRLRQTVLKKLGISESRSLSLGETHGNTMSAMLPLLINDAIESKKVGPGALVALLSIGEGILGGGMLLMI